MSAESIRLRWKSDAPGFTDAHETVLSLDALRGLQESGAVPNNFKDNFDRPALWGAADAKPPDTTFKEYLQDDEAVYRVMKQLRTHGLVFITEIPNLEDALVKIATRMGPMKDTFYGYTWDDLLYFDSPPHVQLLYCIQSSSFGGASVFVDAFKAAVKLYSTDQDAFNTLASIRVNYHYNHPDENLYHTTKPVFELRPLKIGDTSYTSVFDYLRAWQEKQATGAPLPDIDLTDCLEKINWGPPFLAPFSLKEQTLQPSVPSNTPRETLNQKMDRWHAAARKFSAILHKPDNLHERLMQAGQCVLFDNTRVLHARRAFDAGDVGKARWLKGGYVDKDPFFSKLRVLKGKYGKSKIGE
ncbi:hypothetical protein PRZ48_006625 [Zasmidium cellare]|uniref:TauD/TfdA-like domain-containing protein n=1 Tax=Zasmidium cellare TaxID=395010 RepID=A0ABR0EP03_ZASCE|nr:hypothetical protein PRZ48_006625 [Zasmidium cellare]